MLKPMDYVGPLFSWNFCPTNNKKKEEIHLFFSHHECSVEDVSGGEVKKHRDKGDDGDDDKEELVL